MGAVAQHPRSLDPTGEIAPDGPQTFAEALQLIADLEAVIAKLDRRHKGDLLKIANLEADEEAKALADETRPVVELLHACHRAWTKANPDTPKRVKPLDADERRNAARCIRHRGFRTCLAAVLGIAWDPNWGDPGKNGERPCYNTFELALRTTANAERYARKVPGRFDDWPRDPDKLAEQVAEVGGVSAKWVRDLLDGRGAA